MAASNKKKLYFNEAERLYVHQGCTLKEISDQLNLSEKTIRNWKSEGGWGIKKKKYIESKQSFHHELYDFTRTLMKTVKEDLEEGEDVSSGRMFALTKLIDKLGAVKKYEDSIAKGEEEEEAPVISKEEALEMVNKALMGDN